MHDAFISYSRKDVEFARLLEKALKNYKPPKDLGLPQRTLGVFRDQSDLTGAEYFSAVDRQLKDSSKLIVICSPHARASAFVNDEIRRFAKVRGPDHIVSVLLSGIPNNEARDGQEAENAFPDALTEAMGMPLSTPYRGFNVARDRVDHGAYVDSWYTLLANVCSASRTDIEQRERRRRTRKRRIVGAISAGIITVLSVALTITLFFWRDAVKERQIATDQQHIAEEAAKNEKAARIDQQNQRKIADDRRIEADKQKAAAQEEAIQAREEMATRLAVQAVEKVNGTPEKALTLALDAVNTFWSHDDPLVPGAVMALQKVMFGFAGSRPALPWRKGQTALAVDPSLRWVASSDGTGTVVFGPLGSDRPQLLRPPSDALGTNERWADDETRLVFTPTRLISARRIEKAGSDQQAQLWFWKIGERTPDPRREFGKV